VHGSPRPCQAESGGAWTGPLQTLRYHGQPPLRRAEAPTCGQLQQMQCWKTHCAIREKPLAFAFPVFCMGDIAEF
jgi:hypothetical protein